MELYPELCNYISKSSWLADMVHVTHNYVNLNAYLLLYNGVDSTLRKVLTYAWLCAGGIIELNRPTILDETLIANITFYSNTA